MSLFLAVELGSAVDIRPIDDTAMVAILSTGPIDDQASHKQISAVELGFTIRIKPADAQSNTTKSGANISFIAPYFISVSTAYVQNFHSRIWDHFRPFLRYNSLWDLHKYLVLEERSLWIQPMLGTFQLGSSQQLTDKLFLALLLQLGKLNQKYVKRTIVSRRWTSVQNTTIFLRFTYSNQGFSHLLVSAQYVLV